MTKKSLKVLSICLVIGAGIAAYLWAQNCCSGDALCNGQRFAELGCVFDFNVDHNYVDPPHDVYLWIQKYGQPAFYPHLMLIGESPQPLCVLHTVSLQLDANSTYYYYFRCDDCSGRDPDSGNYNVMTGSCGE